MKTLKTIILLVVISLVACKKEAPINYVVFSGKITNTKGGELTINSLNGFSKSINVKDDGVFSDTLYIDTNGLYNLRYESLRFAPYFEKGSNIQLTSDAAKALLTVQMTGSYSELNNYLARKAAKEYDFAMDREGNYNISEAQFEANIEKLHNEFSSELKSIEGLPENLVQLEMNELNYARLLKKGNYEGMYGYLNQNRDFKASEEFKQELNDITYESGDDYMYSASYQRMVNDQVRTRSYEFYQKDSLPYKEAGRKAILEFQNETIRNGELYKSISMGLALSTDKKTDFDSFLKNSTNQKHIAAISELFEALKVLDPGQPSPKFENYENYAGGTTSLDDLKGKYVYVDVWATWCGPCKYEIPFLQKVEKQYHDKNIQFVSISVDKQKDKDKWKSMIAEKELGGIQLITENDFNTPFVNDYKIMGIPQFILIDPDGNIVKSNAPRPSDEKLIELFTELGI